MGTHKVCLIEDDPAFTHLAKIIVRSVDSQAAMINFEDGSKAFDFFQSNKADASQLPDVIFLDLNMPRMDGWGFLEAYGSIKGQIKKNIPIYILSSSISESDISRSRSNDLVTDFISKPLEEDQLAAILKTV